MGSWHVLVSIWAVVSTLGHWVHGEIPESWEHLGQFRFVQHLVRGHLYAPDNQTLFIHRFYYDGEGPPGVTFVALTTGETDYTQGVQLRIKELGNQLEVPATYNRNITLRLPNRLRVQDIDRLVIWCEEYEVAFGRVDLAIAREEELERPKTELIEVGPFTRTEHAISGTVHILDEKTLVLRDFNYDGLGPSVLFYAGEEENLKSGRFLEYPYRGYRSRLGPKKLGPIVSRDIILRLPKQLNAFQLRWLSVWCDTFEVSFGHIEFD